MFSSCSVFVFSMGLTESWRNKIIGHSYGTCPGVIAGTFNPDIHEFNNLTFQDCVYDLHTALEIIHKFNSNIKVLLAVSPVMLVATLDQRGVLQSSIATKSILRAAADECSRNLSYVDYFPSYEIITGPQSRGIFYDNDMREIRDEGVKLVMDCFFKSRMTESTTFESNVSTIEEKPESSSIHEMIKQLQSKCDEAYLDNN